MKGCSRMSERRWREKKESAIRKRNKNEVEE
jgi:hypothetical protein